MHIRKLIPLIFIVMPLLLGGLVLSPLSFSTALQGNSNTYETGSGKVIEIGADEVVHSYSLSDVPTERTGTGDSLLASEYGNRTDSYSNEQMTFDPVGSTATGVNLSVPLGVDWEGYSVFTNITSITENRTSVANSEFSANTNWTYTYYDEPSQFGPTYINTYTSTWQATGGNPGGYSRFLMNDYIYNGLAWHDEADKAYAVQNLTIDRGDVTAAGISLDYWGDIDWSSSTGFCEMFVSIGDPDNGGSYLWHWAFDSGGATGGWHSSGYVDIDPSVFTLPNISLWIGLRVKDTEWWSPDITPRGGIDNLVLYITAKSTPDDVSLQMNGIDVANVMDGPDPIYGLGTAWFSQPLGSEWKNGYGFANFTWTPDLTTGNPDYPINIAVDVDIRLYARRYNVDSVNNTELFTLGENYVATNESDIRWETNHYAAVPGGYSSKYFFNVTLPQNRDIDFVAEPYFRAVNLTSGWSLGSPGDGSVNVSVHEITTTNQNGFWYLKGSSPNMISNLEEWDPTGSTWVDSDTFRANENTRFRATLPVTYENDIVYFTVYSPNGSIWIELQSTVDSSGYAVSSYINLDAYNASVGTWEVQAFVTDGVSGGAVHNVGFFNRNFDIDHSTSMSVKYPVGSESSWTANVTYGDLVLLQLKVNDTDSSELIAGGSLTYDWAAGSGSLSDLGTGEYSITLDTNDLSGNGQYIIDLDWTKSNYDSLVETFTLNVIYTTNLFSSDAPGVDVPAGYNAEINVEFIDQTLAGIEDASISTNWSLDDYSVTPDGGTPGKYIISFETDAVPLGTYFVEITASKDFFESRIIIRTVQVRELYTSAIPSTSHLSLPVGYTTSFTITYTDTDHNIPITGAASAISCNWSSIHSFGDLNYTVVESGTPGVYDIVIFSADLDKLRSYDVVFDVETYGAQNHTFTVSVELRTHLTSFYLVNPIDPTPYTGDISIYVRYYDVDASVGIENGSSDGYNVFMDIYSASLPGMTFSVVNGTEAGEYIILIPASQWGVIGNQDLTIFANWTGPTVKYTNETIDVSVQIIGAPTDIYIGESPVMTPYGENVTFSVIYYDVGNSTGIVNGTGVYMGNVHVYIEVLTAGETLQQSDMIITEVDFVGSPGEYRIEFNTSLLSGLVGCELRLWFNWTAGVLPYYANQSLQITIYSTYRLTTLEWNPIPLTAYDEIVNLSIAYKDVLKDWVIRNDASLSVFVPVYGFTVFYTGDATGYFLIEVDTSSWAPGENSFTVSFEWGGAPFYQNRTDITISITTRYRYTELTHGAYSPVQYGNNLTVIFSYRDLDDYTTSGMNGGTLTLDASLAGFYWVVDIGDGTYTVKLDTAVFGVLGTYTINASMVYGGARYCEDAADSFYLAVIDRRSQLTSELPEPAPYLTLANITVSYTDDTTTAGIVGADVYASCGTSAQALELGVNYWVSDEGGGDYLISISTVALGNFGSYSIAVTVNWTGAPYYIERNRDVSIEVSHRDVSLIVTNSPLSTPFLETVSFQFTATDGLSGASISLDKSHLTLSYGTGSVIGDAFYTLSEQAGIYTISFNSTLITSILSDAIDLDVDFVWGNVAPYYDNATTATAVAITGRATQGIVISTPPASFGFNMSATIIFSDYLTSNHIPGAVVTVKSLNSSSIQSWILYNGDGSYTILVNSSEFSDIGKYFFSA
ncbi:MAG: hypothetical protein ACW98Y_08890, partial [Candidatus Thorarchaeota archaeon]